MAETSPDAAIQGLPAEKSLVSEAKIRSKRKTDKNAKGTVKPPPPCLRGMWAPGRRESRGLRNARNPTRHRSPGKDFQQMIHDIIEEVKLSIRFQPSAVATLQEAAESFVVHYFSLVKICADDAKRVTILLKDSKRVKDMLGISYPSHPLEEKKQS